MHGQGIVSATLEAELQRYTWTSTKSRGKKPVVINYDKLTAVRSVAREDVVPKW